MTGRVHTIEHARSVIVPGGAITAEEWTGVESAVTGLLSGGLVVIVAASDAPAATKALATERCDGVDDHVEVQAALDRLAGIGGTVLLSTGTFTLGATVTQPSRIRVLGIGGYNTLGSADGGTLLRARDGMNADLWRFEQAWWGGELGFVTFDGNKASNSGGSGVVVDYAAEGSEVHHVLVVNAAEDGFVVRGESTPANLRQCSAFGCDGWGFNLDDIRRVVTLWNPSGDSNGAGLLRISGSQPSAITSVVVHSIKGERHHTEPASGNDPAVHIEDYVGPVVFVGGSLDGVGPPFAGTAVLRSGSSFNVVSFQGLRIVGYDQYALRDDTAENNDIAGDEWGSPRTLVGNTTPGGYFDHATYAAPNAPLDGSSAYTHGAVAAGASEYQYVYVGGAEPGDFATVSYEALTGGSEWDIRHEVTTDYVIVIFTNRSAASLTPAPGTIYARVWKR